MMNLGLSLVSAPRGKERFIKSLPFGATLLDVGCGNDSPAKTKRQRPDLYYIGLDVCDYNQTDMSMSLSNEYVTAPPDEFPDLVAKYTGRVDAVVCNHVIEHCDLHWEILHAISLALRPGGRMYLAFPNSRSLSVRSIKPGRSLNFYDDGSHVWPPEFSGILHRLNRSRVKIEHCSEYYRPFVGFLVGLYAEYLWKLISVSTRCSVYLYGTETVIWGRRK